MVATARLFALLLLCGSHVAWAAPPKPAPAAKDAEGEDDEFEDDEDTGKAVDPALLDRMVALNRRALTELGKGKATAAKATLLDAILLGKERGIAQHPVMARTYLHLGAVHINGLNDKPGGLRFLKMAVKLRPQIGLTPQLVTPALEQAFVSAGGRGGSKPPASAKNAPAPTAPAK